MAVNDLDFTQQDLKSQKKVIRRYLNLILAGVKKLLNVALFFAVLSLLFFIAQSWFIAHLCAHLLLASLGTATLDTHLVTLDVTVILGSFCARALCQFVRERLSQKASFKARTDLQNQLLKILRRLGPTAKTFGSEGALSSKLLEQVDALDGFIGRYYVQVILVSVAPILILIATFFYSKLAIVIFAITFPLVIVFMILVGAAAADKNRKQFSVLNQLSSQFLDLMRGMKTIKHFNQDKNAEKLIYDTSEAYRKGTMEVLRLAFLSTGTLEFFSSLSIAAIALYLGLSLMGQVPGYRDVVMIPYQSALFVLLLAPEFYAALRTLGADYHAKAAAEGALTDLIPMLQYKAWTHPGEKALVLASAPAIHAQDITIQSASGSVRLSPLSFTIAPEERVLLKGESGAGKTSLFEALLTFTPYSGEILINAESLQEISRESWHQSICYLSQSSKMISGTIASNLRLAAPEASDEDLFHVLGQVDLALFVRQLPQGVDTPLGERGLGLSGGQLSRLSIAQLLLKDGLLWLIDEPTEHLDEDSAATVLAILEKVTRGKTVLLISHQEEFLTWLKRTIEVKR